MNNTPIINLIMGVNHMRVPKVEHFSDGSDIIHVHYDKPILIPRLPVITNDLQRSKLTKTIERMIRSSMEYKDLIKYLRENIDMDSCQFFHNVSGNKRRGLIEIHHEPFDLFTLTSIVMKKQETELGYIDELVVAEEVMRLHYVGLVGLIPLSVTVHELVHKGKLIVPLNCVYGKFVQFTKEYFDYIDPSYIAMLDNKIELTKNITREDTSILNVRYVYTDIEGFHLPEVMDEVV